MDSLADDIETNNLIVLPESIVEFTNMVEKFTYPDLVEEVDEVEEYRPENFMSHLWKSLWEFIRGKLRFPAYFLPSGWKQE